MGGTAAAGLEETEGDVRLGRRLLDERERATVQRVAP